EGVPGADGPAGEPGEPAAVGDRGVYRHSGPAAVLREKDRRRAARASPAGRCRRQPRADRFSADRHQLGRYPVSDTLIRIYLIGSCDGFDPLREQLATHPELDVVGESEHVSQAAATLAGGHLDCILFASNESTFPAAEVAAVRE